MAAAVMLGRSCINVAGMSLTGPKCGSQMALLMGKRLGMPTLLEPWDVGESTSPFP